MPVDRMLWKRYWFIKEPTPTWPCPECNRGTLNVENGTLHEKESGRSVRCRRDDDWRPESYYGSFCCLLRCGNKGCKEVVAASGASETHEAGEYGELETCLKPRMFTPPLHLLPIPKECPTDVALEFREAFKLYWSDLSGGMNHLRKVVELIMDHLKIRRRRKNARGKLKPLNLHDRIVEFHGKNAELADRLEAVKWLGNMGSHSSDVSDDAFFNACDLLEDFIITYFEKRSRKIGALTKRVNKSKGRK